MKLYGSVCFSIPGSAAYERSKTLSSHRATVRDGVLKSGYTSVIFVDMGAKVDGTYCCDLLLSQQLLPVMCNVSSKYVF